MYIDAKFQEAITQLNPEVRSYVVLDNLIISDDDDLISWSYSIESDSELSGFPAAKIDLEFFSGSNINYEGKEIEVYVGAVFNDETTYIPLGKFIIIGEGQSYDKITGISKVSALDYAIKADVPFDQTRVNYPITVGSFMRLVYAQCGYNNLVIYDSVIDSIILTETSKLNMDPNATCRHIIQQYAAAHLGNIFINRNGQLDYNGNHDGFSWATTVTINDAEIMEFEHEDMIPGIQAFVLSRMPQEDNVVEWYEEGAVGTEYKLVNNLFDDQIREHNLIRPIAEKVFDHEQYPSKLKMFGRPDIDFNDLISVDLNGNRRLFRAQKMEHVFNGGLMTTISSTKLQETQTEYKYAGTKDTVYQTMLRVDKAEQEIKSLIENSEGTTAQISEFQHTLTNFSFLLKKSGGANILKNSVGFNWTLNNQTNKTDIENWVATGIYDTNPTSWNLQNGVSQHGFILGPGEGALTQLGVMLTPGKEYSLKATVFSDPGNGMRLVKIMYDIDGVSYQEDLFRINSGEGIDQTATLNFVAGNWENIRVVIATDTSTGVPLEITDLGLYEGSGAVGWQQNAGEIFAANVLIDESGIKVKHNLDSAYTEISPERFAGWFDNNIVFELNKFLTLVKGLRIDGLGLHINPIKMVQMLEGEKKLSIVWTGDNQ